MIPVVDQPMNPLFTNGSNSSMNACVGDNGGPYELVDYGRGFFEAGHVTVEAAKQFTAPVDVLVYPAAFNYRHGIELYLKQLVLTLNRILVTGEGFKKNHSMIQLWRDVASLTARVDGALIEVEAIDRAGVLIGYFDAFDPTGQVFRYPEDVKGNRHLAQHKLINVEVLRDQMHEVQQILDRWYYQAEDFRQYQVDQLAEHGRD
jgi:hypothetical protein